MKFIIEKTEVTRKEIDLIQIFNKELIMLRLENSVLTYMFEPLQKAKLVGKMEAYRAMIEYLENL